MHHSQNVRIIEMGNRCEVTRIWGCVTIKGINSMRETFVMMESFCVLVAAVVTQIYVCIRK